MVDYSEDSVLVTTLGVYRGLDGIQDLFVNTFAEFSQEGTTLEVEETIVEGEFASLLWHGETPDNVSEFSTDTFYNSADTIDSQTFAGKIDPKD
ncbi:MAG: nuclear transport factor 2 family protein [Haloarculaceae archaeon]